MKIVNTYTITENGVEYVVHEYDNGMVEKTIAPPASTPTALIKVSFVDSNGNPVNYVQIDPNTNEASVSNGQGSKTLTFTSFQTGRYKIVASDILDATTMSPISDVEFDPAEIVLSVVQ